MTTPKALTTHNGQGFRLDLQPTLYNLTMLQRLKSAILAFWNKEPEPTISYPMNDWEELDLSGLADEYDPELLRLAVKKEKAEKKRRLKKEPPYRQAFANKRLLREAVLQPQERGF
jgi:hypothetical protein